MIAKRLRSKTYWLGFATFLLGALETAQATGTIDQLLEPKARAGLTLFIALAIFALRELTKTPISEK